VRLRYSAALRESDLDFPFSISAVGVGTGCAFIRFAKNSENKSPKIIVTKFVCDLGGPVKICRSSKLDGTDSIIFSKEMLRPPPLSLERNDISDTTEPLPPPKKPLVKKNLEANEDQLSKAAMEAG
jgi:hypothetical protein